MEAYFSYINQTIQSSIKLKQGILESSELISKISKVAGECISALQRGNRIILAGNGGSAADAQHIAAEFVSRFEYDRPGLPSIALTTDTSMLTAIGNDYGFNYLFKRQLEANARGGDVFIGITTSGNSPNILEAIKICREREIISVGLTGVGGEIQSLCDFCLNVPSNSTPRIQESHIMIGHIICGLVEQAMFPRV
jgi:D-sedoheptulose 7-phosphate isomerase